MPARYMFTVFFFLFLINLSACQTEVSGLTQTESHGFDSIPVKVTVSPMIPEASGIADSRKNPGYLWVQEDSGQPNELYLLSHSGKILKKVRIKGSTNRDWEDLALTNGKIFIGDIGDNAQTHSTCYFYIFPEPEKTIDTVYNFEKISFQYEDGAHDAEAFLIDPASNDIYIITKRDNPSKIYKISAPYSSSALHTAKYVGQLNFSLVTGAALSPDGTGIMIKTYTSLLYFERRNGEKLETVLAKNPVVIPYTLEPQGEAVCFKNDNSGIYTLSEKGFASAQYLFFYGRK